MGYLDHRIRQIAAVAVGRRTEGERPRPRRPAPFIETLGRAPESAGGNDAMQSGGLGQSRLYCAHTHSLPLATRSTDRGRGRGSQRSSLSRHFLRFSRMTRHYSKTLGHLSVRTPSRFVQFWANGSLARLTTLHASFNIWLSVRLPGAQDGLLPSSLLSVGHVEAPVVRPPVRCSGGSRGKKALFIRGKAVISSAKKRPIFLRWTAKKEGEKINYTLGSLDVVCMVAYAWSAHRLLASCFSSSMV